MALLYYYIKSENTVLIDEGIDLLNNYDEKIILNNRIQPCIKCLLFPQDDILKYNNNSYICLEFDLDIEDCYVINEDFNTPTTKEEYYKSIIKLLDYKFGVYRNPRVILTKGINSNQIRKMDKTIGSPIICDSSNELYIDSIFEEFRRIYSDFDDTMLGVFFMLMSQKGKFNLVNRKKLEDNRTLYIYKDNKTSKIYTIGVKEGNNNV